MDIATFDFFQSNQIVKALYYPVKLQSFMLLENIFVTGDLCQPLDNDEDRHF